MPRLVNLPELFVGLSDNTDLSVSEQYELIRNVSGIGVRIRLSQILALPRAKLKRFDSHPLFFDLKMYDNRKEMISVLKLVASMGASMVSIHSMVDKSLAPIVAEADRLRVKVFATTIPVQYMAGFCNQYFGMNSSSVVSLMISKAREYGCHGYMIPGYVLESSREVRKKVGGIVLCPSVIPSWFSTPTRNEEQPPDFRVLTPAEAKISGAHIVMCHEPIFQGDFPPDVAIEKIKEELLIVVESGIAHP